MNHKNLNDIREDALAVIAEKVSQIQELIKECESIASEAEVEFRLPIDLSNYYNGKLDCWQNSSSNC